MSDVNILVIDNDKFILKTVEKILKRENLPIIIASNRNEALEKVKTADIVLSNVKMPGIDGIELIYDMRKLNKEANYIIMTTVDNEDTSVRAIRAGVNDYIYKPFEPEELVACIKKHVNTIELAKANRKLEEENLKNVKLAAIGNMANTLVHDVKNSMTTIMGFSKILKNRELEQDKINRYVDLILKQSDIVVNKLKEINEFSNGNIHININEVFVVELFNSLIDEYGEVLKIKGVSFVYYFDEKLKNAKINIDVDRIKQAFFNLINNALDAMEKEDKKELNIEFIKRDTILNIKIKDTGRGIPKENIDKLFLPFFTSGKKNGTGLGLAIVKDTIEKNDGKININSELGKGTEFIIKLNLKT